MRSRTPRGAANAPVFLSRTALAVGVGLCLSGALSQSALAQDTLEEIVITAHPLSNEGLAQATTIVVGEELKQNITMSIGETLARQPGIHGASFGQAASRPVIHGLSGARVRVMQDRIDTLDASVTSADHAVTVEPFLANRIEVLRGPASLLYGTGAIGGVVEVHTGRIPHEAAEEPISGRLELRAADNADQRLGALRLDGGGENFAWHIDGFTRDADPFDIPGFAESAAQRAAEEAEGGEEEGEEEAFGTLPGSQLESSGGAVGASWIGENGFLGFSVSAYDANYGLPGGHAHEEGEEEEEEEEEGNPILDMEQTRIDLEGGFTNPFNGIASLNVRIGINDYEHQEFEPNGEAGTTFTNEAFDSRIELVHNEIAGWKGAFGLQIADREFSALGEEAFVEPVDTSSVGIFWVGERRFDGFDLETGLRIEQVEHDASVGPDTDFDTWSFSLGAVVPVQDNVSFRVHSDLSSRAPVAEELYSNGAHLATRTFEIGDPTLDEETAFNLSASVDLVNGPFALTATAYYTNFSDYIYEFATGGEEDGLPIFVWDQADAEFFGVDAEGTWTMTDDADRRLAFSLFFDTVSASLDVAGNDNVPRLPPSRIGAAVDGRNGIFNWRLDLIQVLEQDDVTEFEFVTDSYTDLRAYVGANFDFDGTAVEAFLQGRNLTDDEQRQHTSFIKDFAPLPGRTIEAGVRVSF